MPSVSPAKWHLAHTTWFFERFILGPYLPGYRVYDDHYHFLFNSYYYTQGQMHARRSRGLLSRPTVAEMFSIIATMSTNMSKSLLGEDSAQRGYDFLVELGINHEQQHQELMLTDIKHVFSVQPAAACSIEANSRPTARLRHCPVPRRSLEFAGASCNDIGADGQTAFVLRQRDAAAFDAFCS